MKFTFTETQSMCRWCVALQLVALLGRSSAFLAPSKSSHHGAPSRINVNGLTSLSQNNHIRQDRAHDFGAELHVFDVAYQGSVVFANTRARAKHPAFWDATKTEINDRVFDGIQKRCIPGIKPRQRQRLLLGTDPLLVTVNDNSIRNWFQNARGTQLFANGTLIEESLASLDCMPDAEERERLFQDNKLLSLELIDEVHVQNPGYVHVLPSHAAGARAHEASTRDKLRQAADDEDRIWVTAFSLTGRDGSIHSIDSSTGQLRSVNSWTRRSILWPNESNFVPSELLETGVNNKEKQPKTYDDALLVSDGFLVPGKDKGGLYLVKNPSDPHSEETICITGGRFKDKSADDDSGWFYHRCVWLDLTGDGRKSILTARAKMQNPFQYHKGGRVAHTQLVMLEMPKPHSVDPTTGTAFEEDGSLFDPFAKHHLPWKSRVLDEGPDVMFTVADIDTTDNTVEVISSEFFERKVNLRSIEIGPDPKVVFQRTIDDNCGAPFSAILADLDLSVDDADETKNRVVDAGSTVLTRKPGDAFSHLVITSQQHSTSEQQTTRKSPFLSINDNPRNGLDDLSYNPRFSDDGGTVFAYRVPTTDWKTASWRRTTMASGFSVREKLTNMINPGAPGFVYTFYPTTEDPRVTRQRPMIAIAGDCSESAYILRPVDDDDAAKEHPDPSTRYRLMCEIETGATVGSIGIGYQSFRNDKSGSGFAKLYLPLYEKNKVMVFALGNGNEPDTPDDK